VNPAALRRSAFRCATLFALGVAAAGGCRQVLGVTGYAADLPTGDAGQSFEEKCSNVTYASKTCGECMQTHCCAEGQACGNDPACAALATCLARCATTDTQCRVRCNLGTRRTSAASALMACAAAEHCDACAAGHATFGGLECTRCLEGQAGDALNEFSRNADALELDSCRLDCPPDLKSQCDCTDYAEGTSAVERLENLCRDECDQPDWSCLGHLQAPRGNVDPLDLRVRLVEAEPPGDPVDGATVRACGELDGSCNIPLVAPTSPDPSTGFAELRIPRIPPPATFGHLQVDWETHPEDGGLLSCATGDGGTLPDGIVANRALVYFFPPLLRSPAWAVRRMVSRRLAECTVANACPGCLDWEKYGGVVFSVAACNDSPAANVSIGIDSGDVYYLNEPGAFVDGLDRTAQSGLGAVVDVEEGSHSLEATVNLPGGAQLMGRYDFWVQKGAITTLALKPVPLDP